MSMSRQLIRSRSTLEGSDDKRGTVVRRLESATVVVMAACSMGRPRQLEGHSGESSKVDDRTLGCIISG